MAGHQSDGHCSRAGALTNVGTPLSCATVVHRFAVPGRVRESRRSNSRSSRPALVAHCVLRDDNARRGRNRALQVEVGAVGLTEQARA